MKAPFNATLIVPLPDPLATIGGADVEVPDGVRWSFVYGHRAWLRRVRSPFGGRRLRSLFRVRESDSGLGCRGHGALPFSDRLVATHVMSAGLADAIFAAALGLL
ncbi:MAG TPA: hypothetical protein VIJ07_17165 [Dermatophilaceae bacterium]